MRSLWSILLILRCCTGRIHEYGDSGLGLVPHDATNATSLRSGQSRRLQGCGDELILNGNMEGNTGVTLWGANLGGSIKLRLGGQNDSPNALESFGRTAKENGPSYDLDAKCFTPGQQYILMSSVRLVLDISERPSTLIDKFAKPDAVNFFGLSLSMEGADGKITSIALPNKDYSRWNPGKDVWNVYRAIFTADDLMKSSSKLFVNFFGAQPGTKIIIDDVTLRKYNVPEVVCSKTIFNDGAENGHEYNWSPIVTGVIDILSPGAQGSGFTYRNRMRNDGWDGMKREINKDCLIVGAPYDFTADMKITTDQGKAVTCNKKMKGVGGQSSCPLVSLDYTMPGGKLESTKRWNTDKLFIKWNSRKFNDFVAKFKIKEDILLADKVEFKVVGIEKNSHLYIDNLRFFVGCEFLFINNYAELKHSKFWDVVGGGKIIISPVKYKGKFAFMHIDRATANDGIGQELDAFCLKKDRQFEFIAQVMLVNGGNWPIPVDKWAKEGDDSYLILTLEVTLASGEVVLFDYPNEDRNQWKNGKYNQYRAIFKAGPEFATAKKAFLYLRGPKAGYRIMMDNVFVPEYKPNCFDGLMFGDEEGSNKEYKQQDISVGWKVSEPSFLDVREKGKTKNKLFVEHGDRIAGDPGVSYELDPKCFFEGMNYSFRGSFALRNKKAKPIGCSKDVLTAEADQACPFVGIRMILPSGEEKWIYGRVEQEWDANIFNEISFDFTATADLGNALNVTLIMTGPAPGVHILIDEVDINGIWPSTAPSIMPTNVPTVNPTARPSFQPSDAPTKTPSVSPSKAATPLPSFSPTMKPTPIATVAPSFAPSSTPSISKSSSPSITPTLSSQPTLRPCIPFVYNGDAEMGTTKGWVTSFGGEIDTSSGGADGSPHAFNYHNRDSHSSGPQQLIPLDCIEEGAQYEFTAKITLRDEDNNPFFCSKEATWRSDYFCVVLLIKRENKSGTKFINFANDDSSYWIENKFNSFRTIFTATRDMASLKSFHISMIGPRAGVSIIFDNVVIQKYGGSTSPCNELVFNGDMQRGEMGWKAINGGDLKVEQKGTDVNSFVLKNTNRDTSYSGISQELTALCFVPGIFLDFKAAIMMVDGRGDPITCEKKIETMGRVDRCPSVSLHIVYPTTTTSIQLQNEILSEWVAEDFNLYRSIFEGFDLQDADSVSLIVSGIRPDASIVIDEISLDKTIEPSERGFDPVDDDQFYGVLQPRKSLDEEEGNQNVLPTNIPSKNDGRSTPLDTCSELIKNGDAETGDMAGWSAAFGGKISSNAHGANGSEISFESYGRMFAASGPKHDLDIDCMKEGDEFELTAYIKVKDKFGEPLKSNKHAEWGEESYLTASIYLEKPAGDEIIDLPNVDPSQWIATDFNIYRSVFNVTPNFAGASKVFLYFRGPGVAVSIDFDDVSLKKYTAPKNDCKELIPFGKAKAGNLIGWSVTTLGGYINIDQSDDGDVFFENGERTSQYSGPKHVLDPNCLVDRGYGFEAYLKLVSKDGVPVPCDRGAARDDVLSCPMVTIVFVFGQEEKVYELHNNLPAQWISKNFNRYYSTFAMTKELSSADSAYLYIDGPSPDVTILFDEVTFNEREVPDCNKLIANGGAEDGGSAPWKSFYSGKLDVVKGGANNTPNAFVYQGRTSYTSGPKQSVDAECLVVGTQYEFKAKVKLQDEKGDPFFCNIEAEWRSDFHCTILSIKVTDASGPMVMNLSNENPGLWRENDFNDFTAVFTATSDLLVGKDIIFMLRGPRAGVSIIFDEVSIQPSKTVV